MSHENKDTIHATSDHDVAALQQQHELESWLSACGLNPSLHGPMLKAIGVSKLLHFKVLAVSAIDNDLKRQGTMDKGDIALVIAGVCWYLEWSETPAPKPEWKVACTPQSFEDFVGRKNPNATNNVIAPEPLNKPKEINSERRLDPPTAASIQATRVVHGTQDVSPLLCIPTGELIDAKNTIQSHSILARATVTATSNHSTVPLAVETVPIAPNTTERTKASAKTVNATATVVPKSSQRHEALQMAATNETPTISAIAGVDEDGDDLEGQHSPESNETLARVRDVNETESLSVDRKSTPDTPPTHARRLRVCMIAVGVVVILAVAVGVVLILTAGDGDSTSSATSRVGATTIAPISPPTSPLSTLSSNPPFAGIQPPTNPPVMPIAGPPIPFLSSRPPTIVPVGPTTTVPGDPLASPTATLTPVDPNAPITPPPTQAMTTQAPINPNAPTMPPPAALPQPIASAPTAPVSKELTETIEETPGEGRKPEEDQPTDPKYL